MTDSYHLEQIRALAHLLARRVQDEPTFAEQVRQQPLATLCEAGLPEEFIPEFLEQTQLSEVQGYLSPSCGLTVIL